MKPINKFVEALLEGREVEVVSFVEEGNLTRGEFGVKPVPEIVIWDGEEHRTPTKEEIKDLIEIFPEKLQVGCWDPDYGFSVWPSDDLRIAPTIGAHD